MSVLVLLLFLITGTYLAACLDELARKPASLGVVGCAVRPLGRTVVLFQTSQPLTERPDLLNWRLAPGYYLALAAIGLSVVPLAPGLVAANFEASVVLWGACEALTVVVVFLHGWSANTPLALIGAYRYVAIGLPAMLLSMFVLIAAALPAESLSVAAIVESQREVWNVVRQPPGFFLFLVLGLSLTFRGPMNYADSSDLAGGTGSAVSGPALAIWEGARLAMLVAFSAMAAAAFLGGYLGPVLPGFVWMVLKTLLVLVLMVSADRSLARLPVSRMLTLLWVIALPLSFLVLALVGVELLLWG